MEVPTVDGHEELEIPPGTQSGIEFKLRGEGVPRLRGSGRGDLHVIATLVVPAKLSKKERDLLEQLGEVSAQAVLPKRNEGIFDRLRDIFG